MAFIVPKYDDNSKIYGNVITERVASMAKCACVACNSCTCACSCRGASIDTDIWA